MKRTVKDDVEEHNEEDVQADGSTDEATEAEVDE